MFKLYKTQFHRALFFKLELIQFDKSATFWRTDKKHPQPIEKHLIYGDGDNSIVAFCLPMKKQ